MRSRLFWITIGGLSFWLPVVAVSLALHENVGLWTANVVPLTGVGLMGLAVWFKTNRLPMWGWVSAGIYILGPVSMLAPSGLVDGPASSNVPGETLWMILFCLFPPMTLWISVLNGMIFSVLAASVILPFLAAHLNGRALRPFR